MPKDMSRHEHDAAKKNQFIGAMLSSKNLKQSAQLLDIPYETARKIWRRFREEGHVENHPRTDQPHAVDDRGE